MSRSFMSYICKCRRDTVSMLLNEQLVAGQHVSVNKNVDGNMLLVLVLPGSMLLWCKRGVVYLIAPVIFIRSVANVWIHE